MSYFQDAESDKEYHDYMASLLELVRNYVADITIEDFIEMVSATDFDLEDWITQQEISKREEERLVAVVGKDWKRKLRLKWFRYRATGEVLTDDEIQHRKKMFHQYVKDSDQD